VVALLMYRAEMPKSRAQKQKESEQQNRRAGMIAGLVIAAVIALVGFAIWGARAEAMSRLFDQDDVWGDRFMMWVPAWQMTLKYFPFGSGVGTFVHIFQIDEPYAALNATWASHAHNDLLEILMTGGIFALLLLGAVIYGFGRCAAQTFKMPSKGRASVTFARLGCVLMLLMLLGSCVDYPLRTPAMECLFVIAAVWLMGGRGQAPSL